MTLRVGVVGGGRIAQVMHLPYLDELPQYEIAALADLSEQTASALAARYRIPIASQDFHDVIDADVDLVAVLSPNHYEVAMAAIENGRHVFVEKPLAFDVEEAQALVERATDVGVKLAVGYMKFHDRAYAELRKRVAHLKVRLVRMRVVFGRAQRPARFYDLVEADDVPAGATALASFSAEAARVADTTSLDLAPAETFVRLLNLGCHDLGVLRGVLGEPRSVLTATAVTQTCIISQLEYDGGARAVLEIGEWPKLAVWDEHLEVVADDQVLSLEFGNPWVRYSASRLRHERGTSVEELTPDHHDQFRDQWLQLADVFGGDAEPLGTGADAVSDIELAVEIVRSIQ